MTDFETAQVEALQKALAKKVEELDTFKKSVLAQLSDLNITKSDIIKFIERYE